MQWLWIACVAFALLWSSGGAVESLVEASEDCTNVGHSVTVLVNVKESPQFTEALDNLLKAVPSSVKVLIFPFVPTLHEGTVVAVRCAADAFENVELISHDEPYLTLGESRKWVLDAGLVETKYLLCVENIAYFEPGFVERMIDKMESIREKEIAIHGEEKTAVLIPRLIERCEEKESMWTRSLFKSHAEFMPFTCRIDDVRHLVQGWNGDRSEITLFDREGEYPDSTKGELTEKAKVWLEGEATGRASPLRRIQYVDYLEDHVVLFETAFLREHIGLIGHPDVIWMDDHITEALVVLGAGKKISLALDEVAYLEFFCSFNLEVLPIIAWRRHEAYMQRSCDIEDRFFGVTPTQNCWEWPLFLKRTLFGNIRVPSVEREFPSFAPGEELSGLRHANLIMGALMVGGRNQFQFVVTTTGGHGQVELTDWMEPTEALVFIYRMHERASTDDKRELYVRSKSELVEVTSEQWKETERKAGRALPDNWPGSSLLPEHQELAGNIRPVFKRDLPAFCLYHTGARLWPALEEALAPLTMMSLKTTDYQGKVQNTVFMWVTGSPCPPTISHPSLQLLSTTELIRIPGAHDDASVLVKTFNYRSFSAE